MSTADSDAPARAAPDRLWTVLGGHLDPSGGAAFSVWAPSARAVSVVGDFCGWNDDDGIAMIMASHPVGWTGVWRAESREAAPGHRYKYRVLGHDGQWRDKADPMATCTQRPPGTASVLYRSAHRWQDADWLDRRAAGQPHREPMSVYEVHLGSWRPGLSYRDLADQLTTYVVERGFTHVEFLPVMEHPYGGSWGYQVTGYFAPTARLGEPDDLRYLVDRLHQAGVGVILDWVPAHFPRDEWALARFDGTSLYEHPDPRRGEHPDWGTLIFDYRRAEVREFLISNAHYWFTEFHVDGLRVDAVASMLYLDYSRPDGQWLPNVHGGREDLDAVSFLQELNASVYAQHPGIVMIAEESTTWPGVTRRTDDGGLGFGFKWNMGWMHDTLGYVRIDPVHRRWHHNQITFASSYTSTENFILPISHDEVVHGKGSLVMKAPGDRWRRLATLRALLAFMWAHPGKKLLFMGCELAESQEWSEQRGLDWRLLDSPANVAVAQLVSDLNRAYRGCPAMWSADAAPDGMRWLSADDALRNTYAFERSGDDGSLMVCVVNFAAVPQEGYRLGLARPGRWREVINTDAHTYGGSGVGNLGMVTAVAHPYRGNPASATLRVGPLAAVWLAPADQPQSTDPPSPLPTLTLLPMPREAAD